MFRAIQGTTHRTEDHAVPTNTRNDIRTRRVIPALTPLALVLAAGLTGCGETTTVRSNSHFTPTSKNSEFSAEGKASLANIAIDPAQAESPYTGSDYVAEGSEFELPQQWVSEARESTADIRYQRAYAQSMQVGADANYTEALAGADAELQDGFVSRDTGYADAVRTESIYNARIDQMQTEIQARGVEANAEFQRQERFLSASVSEWQAEIERMRTKSERDWAASLAEHDRMLATYQAVQERGQAEINGMVQTAELTEDRAVEKVQTLRAQASSVAQETAAEVSKINQLISTTAEQTQASVSELRQRAESLDSEFSSEIATLGAKADQFEASDADANYKLEAEAAQVNYETSLASAEDMRMQAEERATRDRAELERLTSDANAALESSKTSYEEARKWIAGHYSNAIADVDFSMARADHVEYTARSAFVKAETDARVAALVKQAEHDEAISEAELAKIQAESLAEARRIQAEYAKEFAAQAKKGSVEIPSNSQERPSGASEGDEVPTFKTADAKPVHVDPDRVANFKIELAKASKIRRDADSARLKAVAARDAEMAKFQDWWNGKQSEFNTAIASANAFQQKSDAEVSRLITRADSMIAAAETELARALVEAESGRTEVLATIETLRGNASTLDKKRAAQVKQLFAQADATARIGESKVASLKVQRDAVARRGEAKSAQLLAEASSLEQSQRAVVAQMNEEINGARKILDAELARLDQATKSYVAIAEANYNEGIAMADAFERISIANTSELTARHIASRQQADADIAYMQRVAQAGQLKRDAAVTRLYAEADKELAFRQAQDIAARGSINADHAIALAGAEREFAVADARDAGVRSRFDHRVAMTQSDRNRAYAELYASSQDQIARTEIAQAQAQTYSELSLAALERLNTTAKSFSLTAQRNWDSRLAMPTNAPSYESIVPLTNDNPLSNDFSTFANVETDTE